MCIDKLAIAGLGCRERRIDSETEIIPFDLFSLSLLFFFFCLGLGFVFLVSPYTCRAGRLKIRETDIQETEEMAVYGKVCRMDGHFMP